MRYIAALALLLVSVHAAAEMTRETMAVICGPTEEMVSQLRDKYNETVVWNGKEPNGNLTTVWVNTDNNTFTIIKTSPDGKMSCSMSAGTPGPEA
jgi:CTP:phosphocholine cytidylyltransferase-like protein